MFQIWASNLKPWELVEGGCWPIQRYGISLLSLMCQDSDADVQWHALSAHDLGSSGNAILDGYRQAAIDSCFNSCIASKIGHMNNPFRCWSGLQKYRIILGISPLERCSICKYRRIKNSSPFLIDHLLGEQLRWYEIFEWSIAGHKNELRKLNVQEGV